ncbi:hypothetical protein E0H75_42440 [Kribbella capetownensis]|uniref:Uncharacterized protein n=1 Tax=Kribbella capetownensis TaxID=1572659 RepID=A0A4R0IR35_9ACTN|nr:hypothetical protein [Kribbella capetownensis]TCC33916.1 hypothetical protein E0H75_42440 [Kribbella capetownensis]
MQKRTGRGRPAKGKRGPTIALKLPIDHAPVYEACAQELGIPVGDFVAMCMAQIFANGATSNAERAHFAIPDYITSQIAAKHERDAQMALVDQEGATQAA